MNSSGELAREQVQQGRAAPKAGSHASPATSRRMAPRRWLTPVAVALALLPLAKLAFDALTGGFGAEPVAEVLNRLGFWSLAMLLVALTPTPLAELAGWKWTLRLRRALGLVAFGYVALHLAWYLGVDQFFDLAAIAEDVVKRAFIAFGFCAFLLLVPLALTSTDRMVRRLGFLRWKRLHRLVYLAALFGVVHFWWRVKADHREPLLFGLALAALLAARVPGWLAARRRSDQRRGPEPLLRG